MQLLHGPLAGSIDKSKTTEQVPSICVIFQLYPQL